jgi:hypothetical protein
MSVAAKNSGRGKKIAVVRRTSVWLIKTDCKRRRDAEVKKEED